GKPCFGPVTLGGCGAICPSNGFICEACRGPLEGTSIEKLQEIMKGKMDKKDLMKIAEIYGVKKEFEEN
ncbi:MAG: oxidoreductase, partial [Candidatus Pacebacteria bacterium]|nr:oxidoreductase [Candidatus Paceibacterota bacterium]